MISFQGNEEEARRNEYSGITEQLNARLTVTSIAALLTITFALYLLFHALYVLWYGNQNSEHSQCEEKTAGSLTSSRLTYSWWRKELEIMCLHANSYVWTGICITIVLCFYLISVFWGRHSSRLVHFNVILTTVIFGVVCILHHENQNFVSYQLQEPAVKFTIGRLDYSWFLWWLYGIVNVACYAMSYGWTITCIAIMQCFYLIGVFLGRHISEWVHFTVILTAITFGTLSVIYHGTQNLVTYQLEEPAVNFTIGRLVFSWFSQWWLEDVHFHSTTYGWTLMFITVVLCLYIAGVFWGPKSSWWVHFSVIVVLAFCLTSLYLSVCFLSPQQPEFWAFCGYFETQKHTLPSTSELMKDPIITQRINDSFI